MSNMKPYKKSLTLSLTVGLILAVSGTSFAMADSAGQDVKSSTKQVAQPTRKLVDQTNPYKMVEKAAEQTFKRFAREEEAIKLNPNLLKNIVREELMPYINYKYSALKVIGKQKKKPKRQEIIDFFPVFREYLVTSYAQVFTLYDNQEVQFSPEKPFKGKKIIAVNTRIIMPGSDNIDVSFKVRRDKKTNQWQAFDMVAEGVSLLDSKKAELGGIIRQKGLAYVTELLKKKSSRDIVFKNAAKQKVVATPDTTTKAK